LTRGRRDDPDQEIRVRDARARRRLGALPPRGQPAHVHLAHQIEVWRGGPALRHALGHDAPDGPDAGRGHRRRRPLGGRGHVGGEHGAARAGAAQRGQVEAALGREPPRLRRRRGQSRGRAVAAAAGLARVDVGQHVRLLDPAARRRHAREIDAVLLGEPAREGRGLDGHDGRVGLGGPRLARAIDQRDGRADPDHVARARAHRAQHARGRRLELHRHLVRLDLDDRLALAHGVAGRLQPAQDLAGLLRELQRRHDDGGRHHAFRQSARAASNTDCSLGTVRSSSTGENGTGTSIAPIRLTGASRW
jgi:hypothetical protein